MPPLGDETRRPSRFPVAAALVVLVDASVFGLEPTGGDAFVTRWAPCRGASLPARHVGSRAAA